MNKATHDDIVRLLPGIQDHTVLEILAVSPSVGEVEAAAMLLADQDEGLVEMKREASATLSALLDILSASEIAPVEARET